MANERAKAKKAQAATARAEFQQKRQRRALIRRGLLGAVLLSVAGGVGYCVLSDRQLTAAIVTAAYPAGQHIAGRITYKENPPIGGPHNVVWQTCGVYSAPIHTEHAVHSLEHGAVWITYRPDLPVDQIEHLQAIASDDYMLISPFPGLPVPVVASSWNHQIRLDGVDDPRLPSFIRRFKNNPQSTPEFGASCRGGTAALATDDSLNTGTGPMAR